ncbi:MAG: hypothetical protein PHZ02_01605 [Desulfocapsaceae bacterium]|nr:hypothetical protein [Desulfocapsaceae bacterium]
MKFEQPTTVYNSKGDLSSYIIGKCEVCGKEIDNFKEAFIEDKSKIYHANTCYKI